MDRGWGCFVGDPWGCSPKGMGLKGETYRADGGTYGAASPPGIKMGLGLLQAVRCRAQLMIVHGWGWVYEADFAGFFFWSIFLLLSFFAVGIPVLQNKNPLPQPLFPIS